MTRNEILLNLFKSTLEPRVESLERDNTSHSSDLKICNDFVKEIDLLFNEIKSLLSTDANINSKDSVYLSRNDDLTNQSMMGQSMKREKTPPLHNSKTTLKIKPTRNIESSPASKKHHTETTKPLNPTSVKRRVLTKTKTVSNLKMTQNSSSITVPSKTPKEDHQKSKLSLKNDSTYDPATPKTSKHYGPSFKEPHKPLEKNPTSRSMIGLTKSDSVSNSSGAKKNLVKHQTTKGPILKSQLEEKKNEETKKEVTKSKRVSSTKDVTKLISQENNKENTTTIHEFEPKHNPPIEPKPNQAIEFKPNQEIEPKPNQAIETKPIVVEEKPVPKEPEVPKIKQLNLCELLGNNWVSIAKFLTKNDLMKSKLINKQISKQTLIYYSSLLEQDVKSHEEKIAGLKEKNKDEELIKPLTEFTIGRSAAKALKLLNQEKYKELFKSEKIPQEDILLPYRIYFTFMNQKEVMTMEDADFWKECCKFFLSDAETGDFISNSVKSFNFSDETLFQIYRLTINKDKKLLPSFYSKICSTTGIVIFLIKDTLEYIGLFSTDKKTTPVANKLYKLCNAILEQSKLRLEYLKELTK